MERLERKKLEMQLKQVEAKVAELDFKIEERKEDIKRIENHIVQQKEREQEIKEQLGS